MKRLDTAAHVEAAKPRVWPAIMLLFFILVLQLVPVFLPAQTMATRAAVQRNGAMHTAVERVLVELDVEAVPSTRAAEARAAHPDAYAVEGCPLIAHLNKRPISYRAAKRTG